MKTVFYGNTLNVIPILEILDSALIVTTEKYITDPVIAFALKNNIPYLSTENLNESVTLKRIQEVSVNSAVLADFGLKIPASLLNFYPKGIINVHPSLLPKYRGPTPVQTAILNGDLISGVSIIKLDSEIDHGPIIAQKEVILTEDDTSHSAYLKLFKFGADLLTDTFEKYLTDQLQPTEQDHTKATFTTRLTRQSGFFHIENPPPVENLQRMIRAYYPWPGVWTHLHTKHNEQDKILKFLPENKLQMEGKKPINLKDFYNGYPELKDTIQRILNLKS